MEIRHEGEVHWDLKCRRCGRTICGRTGKREGGKTHRFAVYCDACAEVIARREEKARTWRPGAVPVRRVTTPDGKATEYRGAFPALVFAGRAVKKSVC